jgi:F0F1-type ATP synthase assembly protein I
MLRALRRPIRTVLVWQLAVTALVAVTAAIVADTASALSAAAGGGVSIVAGLAAAFVASLSAKSAGGALAAALRAEAVKLGLALLLLWLVLANYPETVVAVFLGAFVATMLIFSMAFFVREY